MRREGKSKSVRRTVGKVSTPKPAADRSMVTLVGELASGSSETIKRAAAILEEELAAGVVAARQVEKKLSGTATKQPSDTDQTVSRLRKDAHDLVDIFMDSLAAASRSLDETASRLSALNSDKTKPRRGKK